MLLLLLYVCTCPTLRIPGFPPADGSAAVALEVLSADGDLHQRIKRNHVRVWLGLSDYSQ